MPSPKTLNSIFTHVFCLRHRADFFTASWRYTDTLGGTWVNICILTPINSPQEYSHLIKHEQLYPFLCSWTIAPFPASNQTLIIINLLSFTIDLTILEMAPHSSTLAWKIPWMEEPGRLQSMGSLRVGHYWATSLSLFTFMHWRRKWQPTPVFLPGESQGRWSLIGCRLWGCTESDTTEVT